MTYRRIRNQELSIKIKPTNSSSNILYEPDFIFNDVKQYLEKKYPNELLIDSQEKVGIDFFTKKMLNNENVSIFGDGNEYRDYIYIEDVISFVFKIIDNEETGIFNISSGETTATIDIFNNISNIIGYKNPPIFLDSREGDIFGIEIDNSKSKSIGWKPRFDLKSGLTETINFLNNKSQSSLVQYLKGLSNIQDKAFPIEVLIVGGFNSFSLQNMINFSG